MNFYKCMSHPQWNVKDLVQDCSNSIANALELLQSCSKPWGCLLLFYSYKNLLWFCEMRTGRQTSKNLAEIQELLSNFTHLIHCHCLKLYKWSLCCSLCQMISQCLPFRFDTLLAVPYFVSHSVYSFPHLVHSQHCLIIINLGQNKLYDELKTIKHANINIICELWQIWDKAAIKSI